MPNEADSKPAEDDVNDDGVGLEALRASLGDLVLRAGFGNERIPITRHGKPVAVLIGMKDLERLRALDAEPASAAVA